MVVAAGGQVRDLDRGGVDARLAGLIGDGDHGVGVGDEQALADQSHAEGRHQAGQEDGLGFGHAIAVGVAQQGDAVRAGRARARLAHDAALEPAAYAAPAAGFRFGRGVGLGDQNIAIGQFIEPARVVQTAGEGVDRQTLCSDGRDACGPADGGSDLDRWDALDAGRRQLRVRPEAEAFGQGALGLAG
ncbi:hypothetical protein D3C80_1333990 [compost metagenome]